MFCVLRDNEKITLGTYGHCTDEACKCHASLTTSLQESRDSSGSVTLLLRKGFYHNVYRELNKVKVFSLLIIMISEAVGLEESSWPKFLVENVNLQHSLNPSAFALWLMHRNKVAPSLLSA